jgi:GDPmannose 4,6-dehydratase|tara:strand:- start:3806 stop:4849 length:1044 start_codon:yes stop_codon:yes gene_type:complete
MKKVIITGVTGQVGSYMADFLLKFTDLEVYGAIRRLSVPNHKNIEKAKLNPKFKLIEMDLTDEHSMFSVIQEIKPDYFINFAANSFVGNSWHMPANHFDVNALGVMRQLEAIRKICPDCKYYNAGSSEEFGDVMYSPQDLNHPPRPRSPYGASKVAARQIVKVWRDSYNLFAIQGYLFNHESERRGEEFVTRKISMNAARIKKELNEGKKPEPFDLGNIEAKRDWSHAYDFVRAVWLMLNEEKPKDYLLASGETHTVREFVEKAFEAAEIETHWHEEDNPINTKLIHTKTGSILLNINKDFYRPAEVELLLGDPSEAQKDLHWEKSVDFATLVRRMVVNDIEEINAT